MAPYCPGSVIFFARDASHPLLAAHRARGGRAVYVQNDAIVRADGAREERVAALSQVPLTQNGRIGFQVENVLAAVGAAWGVGLPEDAIRTGLASFVNDSQTTPARFNVYSYAGATVIVDYGHNVDALVALIEAIGRFPHDRRLVVYTAAGDRRDADIIRQAEIIGNGFDRVIIYEDKCTRGRPDGEVVSLMRRGLGSATRVSDIFETRGEFRAIEDGLAMLTAGDLILVQADQVEASLAFIEQFIAANSAATVGSVLACACDVGAAGHPLAAHPQNNGQTDAGGQTTATVASGQTQPMAATAIAEK
jgi:cyanophycin synthetase